MKLASTYLKLPAIISSALVLPFILLELVNRRTYHEGFPIPLFGMLWLLPMAFILILRPIVRKVRIGDQTSLSTTRLVLGGAILILIAGLWVSIILDQLPCFLGVPLCD